MDIGIIGAAVYKAAHTSRTLVASQRNQGHGLLVSRLEAHGGAGWDVEPHTQCQHAVEAKGAVDLEEVGVRANLDGPVARVGDHDIKNASTSVELNLAVFEDIEALRVHYWIGLWQDTSLVPSWKVASIWTRVISTGMPSMTSSRLSTSPPM